MSNDLIKANWFSRKDKTNDENDDEAHFSELCINSIGQEKMRYQ